MILTTQVPAELHEATKQVAKEEMLKMSDIVRKAIVNYIVTKKGAGYLSKVAEYLEAEKRWKEAQHDK